MCAWMMCIRHSVMATRKFVLFFGLFFLFIQNIYSTNENNIEKCSSSNSNSNINNNHQRNDNCLKCGDDEIREVYCLPTGYKSLISCIKDDEENDVEVRKYISCSPSMPSLKVSSYTISPVLTFQIFMALFGGLAYWGVQTHRENSMTQFDSRRYRQRYSRIQTV